jgi:hypothetical protein
LRIARSARAASPAAMAFLRRQCVSNVAGHFLAAPPRATDCPA